MCIFENNLLEDVVHGLRGMKAPFAKMVYVIARREVPARFAQVQAVMCFFFCVFLFVFCILFLSQCFKKTKQCNKTNTENASKNRSNYINLPKSMAIKATKN